MKKILLIVLLASLSVIGRSQEVNTIRLDGIAIDEPRNNPLSLGVGFDLRVSDQAYNFGIPVELRILSPSDDFTIHVGERVSFHYGGDDSTDYYDNYFGMWLWQPSVGFTQFSTYLDVRWNFFHVSEKDALYFGLGYYFNVNTFGRAYIDVPNVSYISGRYQYSYNRDHPLRYHFDDLVNPVSHTLKAELGFEASFLEVSLYCTFDVTKPYKRAVADSYKAYDVTGHDRSIRDYSFTNDSRYLGVNFYSFNSIADAVRDLCYFGISLKVFLFGDSWQR